MRAVSVDSLLGEEILGKNIYDEEGRALLTSGTKVVKTYIDKLKEKGYYQVYIDDEVSEGIEINDIISERTRKKCKDELKEQFSNIINTQDFEFHKIVQCIEQIMDEILLNPQVVVNIADIKKKDEYTYSHSINVCALAISIGYHLNLNTFRLRELAIGAMLHDLGKIMIPVEILMKQEHLSVDEIEHIRKHPQFGYDLLCSKYNASPITKNIVLMHHEKCNGSGYPFGAQDTQIHQLTKLVTICDIYDAMVSDRPYRAQMKPYQAIEYIMSMSMSELDNEMVEAFTKHIAPYPVGAIVRLNNGMKGIIVRQNSILSRPVVRIFEEPDGTKTLNNFEVDLTKELTLFVHDVLDG